MQTGGLSRHYLPRHQFAECHSVLIHAPARAVMEAALHDPGQDRLIRLFTALREIPGRLGRFVGMASGRRGQQHRFSFADFTPLGRDEDREIAYGLAGCFWRADYGLAKIASPEDFHAYAEPGCAKLVLTFTTSPEGNATRLTTQTRIFCMDEAARRNFLPYWLLIRPVSGYIRRRILHAIRKTAEAR